MPYLFERIELVARRRGDARAAFDLRQAVRAQLQRLVGTHVWPGDTGLELMDLGLAPVVGLHDPQDMARYAHRMAELIRRHEPRLALHDVRLTPVGDASQPWRLVIEGTLPGAGDEDSFRFELPLR